MIYCFDSSYVIAMNCESRTNNSLRNMLYGMGGQLLGLLLSFISRTIFIQVLGVEYLGVNGLFSNILSMLSLTELGVGSAITYSMYKPLAQRDEYKIKALMGLYSTAYRVIGCVVAVLGVSIIPFLEAIIKDKADIPHVLPDLVLIYCLFLASSVSSYFFAHKSAILIADQKQYLTTIYTYGYNLAQNAVQILLLLATGDFLLYLIIQILARLLYNVSVSRQADKMYPFLKSRGKAELDTESKGEIAKNTGAMMFHKVGTFVVCGTDNILISMFAGVYWVGIYSNYNLILGIVENFISTIFSSLTASVGHLNTTESREKSYSVFKITFFINFWAYGFSTLSLWILLNPFITLWIGSQYVFSPYIVLIIVLNFFVTGMRQAVLTYKNTMGLFWHDRYKPLAEAVINLSVSLSLAPTYGIAGVLWGTFISSLTTCFWIEPFILYKHGFRRPLTPYFQQYLFYLCVAAAALALTELACTILPDDALLSVIGRMIFCLVIPNAVFSAIFYKTQEFDHVLGVVRTEVFGWWQCFKDKKRRGLSSEKG